MGLEIGFGPGIVPLMGNLAWNCELGPGIVNWAWKWDLVLELSLELGLKLGIEPGIGNWACNGELDLEL